MKFTLWGILWNRIFEFPLEFTVVEVAERSILGISRTQTLFSSVFSTSAMSSLKGPLFFMRTH
jgi:hypothetical protein